MNSVGTLSDSALARFWAALDATGECWLWTRAVATNGYARFSVGQTRTAAHRVAYEHYVGRVPDGMQLDHLCRMRRCVNPLHLEPVSSRENLLRAERTLAAINRAKTECRNGHELVGDNIKHKAGARACRTCDIRSQESYRRRRGVVALAKGTKKPFGKGNKGGGKGSKGC